MLKEKDIEKYFKNRIEQYGGKSFKFSSPGNNGVPDRIVLIHGLCYFVELKRPGSRPRKLQKAVISVFQKLGFEVFIIDSFKKVDEFIKRVGGDLFHG